MQTPAPTCMRIHVFGVLIGLSQLDIVIVGGTCILYLHRAKCLPTIKYSKALSFLLLPVSYKLFVNNLTFIRRNGSWNRQRKLRKGSIDQRADRRQTTRLICLSQAIQMEFSQLKFNLQTWTKSSNHCVEVRLSMLLDWLNRSQPVDVFVARIQ